MDDGERLAAYLVDELTAEERREVEAALARDPSIRARLAALRRSDEALASLGDVEPPPDFSERLRAVVSDEIARLHPRLSADEVTARRAARGRRSWGPGIAAAAAVVTVLAVGVAITSLGGANDSGGDLDVAAEDTGTAAMLFGDGPVVVALEHAYGRDEVAGIADDPAIQDLIAQGLGADAAFDRAAAYAAGLGVGDDGAVTMEAPAAGAAEEAGPAADSADETVEQGADGETLRERGIGLEVVVRGDADPEDLQSLQACLPSILEGAGTVVPVYAEIATYEGAEALVYGLVGADPDSGRFTRPEIWVVDRGDCQVRLFTQP